MSTEYVFKILKDDREKYDRINPNKKQNDKDKGELDGISNTELFLLSMMTGYYSAKDEKFDESQKTTDTYIRETFLTDDAKHLINAIAVADTEDIEILVDKLKMYKIAEKYATKGIEKLYDLYFENEHNFIKRMEKILLESFKNQNIGDFNSDSEIE